jgi:hypothetical protein
MTKSKLCLVDSRITNFDIFMENVNSDTVSILIDYKVDTFDSLFNKIKDLTDLDLTLIDSIAYVAHGTFQPTYSFLKNEDTFEMDKKESWEPLFNFLLKFNGLKYFDFLGCNLASNSAWKQVFNWIEDSKGINLINFNVRASTDATGNLVSGGNWILEDGSDSVSVDAKNLYFTNLDSFEGLLATFGEFMSLDGLYTYTITSINPNTVTLTNCPTKTEITDVTILTTVTLNASNRLTLAITIPNGEYTVTSIGGFAFNGCTYLTTLILPDTVTNIGDSAFRNCSALTSLTLPKNLTTIQENAFYNCTGLISLTLPNSLTSIEYYAFNSCNALTSLTLPKNLTTIGEGAFVNCWVLASLTIPINSSLMSIGDYALYGCKVLGSLTLPDSVTFIGVSAFTHSDNSKTTDCYYSQYGKYLVIQNNTNTNYIDTGLNFIQQDNFQYTFDTNNYTATLTDCLTKATITSANIPTTVTKPGDKSIDYPVTSIGKNALSGCIALTSIILPENSSLITISDGAFNGCIALKSIILPEKVETIGDNSFNGCVKLTSILVPEKLETYYV